MRGGVRSASKPSRGGSGRQWILPVGPSWHRSLGDGRRMCFSNGQSSWHLCTSPASLPMDGAPTHGISIPRRTRWTKPIRRKSQTSPSGSCWIPGSWICRGRLTALLLPFPPRSPYFSITLNRHCPSRATWKPKPPESNKSAARIYVGSGKPHRVSTVTRLCCPRAQSKR